MRSFLVYLERGCGIEFDVAVNVNVPAPGGSARLTAMRNRMTDKGAGAGTFFNIGPDDCHRIIGNASLGWGNVFPTSGVGVLGASPFLSLRRTQPP
jgi:hypothetical protein